MDPTNGYVIPQIFANEDAINGLIYEWCVSTESDNFEIMRQSFVKMAVEVMEEIRDTENPSLQHTMLNRIHDLFMPIIKHKHRSPDYCFFQKCITLVNANISPEHLGADKNYTIRLSAAIVELSVLDSFKSPLEKMACLQTTYDLVYAELKTAIFSVISKYSDKECEIPVINKDDVIPLLMVVIVKSKLEYFITNMMFIRKCLENLTTNIEFDMILSSFQTAIDNLQAFDETSLGPDTSCELIKESLALEEYMRLCSSESQNHGTVIGEDRERILNLIFISTSDEQQPLEQPQN